MRALGKPKPGLMRTVGRLVLRANLARSWDGWGVQERGPDGNVTRIDWMPLAVIPFQLAGGGFGIRIYLLWLALYVGVRPK